MAHGSLTGESPAALAAAPDAAAKSKGLRGFSLRGSGLFIAIIVILIGFTIQNPLFASPDNLLGILRAMSSYAIMALGLMLVIVVGEIDLSFGSTYGLAANLIAVLWIVMGLPVWAAIAITMIVSAGVGAFNAFFTSVLKIPSFIVTLGSMNLIYGATLFVSNTGTFNPSYPPPGAHVDKGQLQLFQMFATPIPLPGGVTLPGQVVWLAVVAIVFAFVVHRSIFGFRLKAIGGNPVAATLARLPVTKYKFIAFIACALMAALAATLDFSFIQSTTPNLGQSFTFPVFAAVIIGGASLSGGKGTVVGTLGGALLLAILVIGLAFLAAGPFLQTAFVGAVTIGAVAIDRYSSKKVA